MELQLSKSQRILFLFGAALLFVGIRIYLIDSYGVMTPYWDDWGIGQFLNNSVSRDLTLADFFQDANEHRLVFNRILSLTLFNVNQQQWDPMVSMLANAVIWSLSGVFLIRLALQYQNQISAPLLITLLVFLWSFPFAFVNIIWGVQTHTYTMILFSLLGCWYSGYQALSLKWWCGMLSLAAAGLTLAGGTFAAFAVVGVQILTLIFSAKPKKDTLITMGAALAAGMLGLVLILIQKSGRSGPEIDIAYNAMGLLYTLSWPMARDIWPAVIFIAPVLMLGVQAMLSKTVGEPLVRFSLCLYGFILIIAIAIAYARGFGDEGPARRYFEFLSLSSFASFLALLSLHRSGSVLGPVFLRFVTVAWLVVFIYAIPFNSNIVDLSVEKHLELRPIQTNLVKNYQNTKDKSWFERKPFEHVPYPSESYMDNILDDLNQNDVLPYRLQTPDTVIQRKLGSSQAEIKQSPFIKNGTFKVSTNEFGVTPFSEVVWGSYKPVNGAIKATGSFTSEVFKIERPYVSISVTGYFGYPDMSLSLLNELSGEKIEITVPETDSGFAEIWREVLVKVPRGYYRLVAQDNSSELWFGFSTPRSVGRLSYWTQQLLEQSFWFWRIAVLMMLVALARPIAAMFKSHQTERASC